MEKWEEKKLEDVCLVGDGAHTSIKRCQTGIPYLTAKNFTSKGLDLRRIEFISEEDYIKHFCKKTDTVLNVKAEDLVFSIIGSIGSVYIVKENDTFGLSSSVAILRPRKGKIASRFLYYWMLSDGFQTYVENIKSGAAQGFLSLGMIKKLPVLCLPLPNQMRIAKVLATYDDLINNNNRRIELLEKVAQELYKEWFVRFRFPNHENTKLVNGLPEGWEVKKVRSIVKRLPFGSLYKENELTDEGAAIVIDQSQKEYLGFHNNEPSHRASKENPIIIFGDHSCKMKLMMIDFSLAENVVPFTSQGQMPISFLYYTVRSLIETSEYKRHWTEFMNKKVLIPDHHLQKKYDTIVRYNEVLINSLTIQTRNLKKQRDLLLPRLMSGRLEV